MDNRMSLQEYLSSFRTVSEKREVFYAIFEEMHRFHNNGEYLDKVHFQSISVCYTNPTDIHFAYYQKIGGRSVQEVLRLKFQNILQLSQMMVCAFIEYDFSTAPICLDVLRAELVQLRDLFDPVDYSYLEQVFIQKEFLYYDDYIRNLGQEHPIPFQEKRSISESEQAFTTYFLLTINLIVISLIFSCIFLYLP